MNNITGNHQPITLPGEFRTSAQFTPAPSAFPSQAAIPLPGELLIPIVGGLSDEQFLAGLIGAGFAGNAYLAQQGLTVAQQAANAVALARAILRRTENVAERAEDSGPDKEPPEDSSGGSAAESG